MNNPIPPSVRCSVPEWNRCIDHEMEYLGMGGPDWLQRHDWLCLDESHEQNPPLYHTLDGSGKFDSQAVSYEKGITFYLRKMILELRDAA